MIKTCKMTYINIILKAYFIFDHVTFTHSICLNILVLENVLNTEYQIYSIYENE